MYILYIAYKIIYITYAHICTTDTCKIFKKLLFVGWVFSFHKPSAEGILQSWSLPWNCLYEFIMLSIFLQRGRDSCNREVGNGLESNRNIELSKYLQKFILPSPLNIQKKGLKTKQTLWGLSSPNLEIRVILKTWYLTRKVNGSGGSSGLKPVLLSHQ